MLLNIGLINRKITEFLEQNKHFNWCQNKSRSNQQTKITPQFIFSQILRDKIFGINIINKNIKQHIDNFIREGMPKAALTRLLLPKSKDTQEREPKRDVINHPFCQQLFYVGYFVVHIMRSNECLLQYFIFLDKNACLLD